MDGHERRVFRVFSIGTVYEILEEKKVPRTTLNNSEKPVPQFEFSAARIGFLSGDKCREGGIGVEKSRQGSQGCAERGNKRCVQ
jgi:hypothetical protein